MNKKKEFIIGFILLTILFLTLLIVKFIRFSDFSFYVIVGWLISTSLTFLIGESRYKLVKYLYNLLFFLSITPLIILGILLPILAILSYLILYIIIITTPILILNEVNTFYNIIAITFENKLFIILTYSSIIAIVFNKYLISYPFKLAYFLKFNTSEGSITDRLKKMIEYVITPQNIRFVIYSIYFIYLSIFSFRYLDSDISFASKSIYTAIMQSFFTFLAYDSLRINSSQVIFLPSKLFSMLLKYIAVEFNEIGIGLKETSEKIQQDKNK
jgi:hypothetical protein